MREKDGAYGGDDLAPRAFDVEVPHVAVRIQRKDLSPRRHGAAADFEYPFGLGPEVGVPRQLLRPLGVENQIADPPALAYPRVLPRQLHMTGNLGHILQDDGTGLPFLVIAGHELGRGGQRRELRHPLGGRRRGRKGLGREQHHGKEQDARAKRYAATLAVAHQ